MIISVEDLKAFHSENIKINKQHYTYSARFTKAKLVNYFQDRGAKVHFNYIKYIDPELSKMTGNQEEIVYIYLFISLFVRI